MTDHGVIQPAEPTVAVLLATHNGVPWLREQVDSILAQRGVRVSIHASDDASHDATPKLLSEYVANPSFDLLPTGGPRMGNANRNFLRLVHETDIGDAQYVAFSDQDDVWFADKLEHAVQTLRRTGFEAYSSNVLAFWPDGATMLLVKSQPQRRFDYLFEAPGPGCTFVLTRNAFDQFHRWVRENYAEAREAAVHDWLIYAFARVKGWRWHIDPRPGLNYRQHDRNEAGANVGIAAILRRAGKIRDGRFRLNALRIATLVGDDSWMKDVLQRMNWRDRLRLACAFRSTRRRFRDALVIILFAAFSR